MNDPKAPFDWSKIDGFEALVELALNLHWSWNHAADELWEGLDKELWTATQNPWVILRTVSKEKIKDVLGRPGVSPASRFAAKSQSGIVQCGRMVSEQASRILRSLRLPTSAWNSC